MQRSYISSFSLVAMSLAFFAGCAGDDVPPNYKTTVEIVYKGEPIPSAMVTLRPDGHEAPSATGVTGEDGTVDLFSWKGKGKGVAPGKYLVGVEKQNIEAVEIISSDDPNYGKETGGTNTYEERDDVLPAKYISAARSGLTCTVTEDASQNVFKFELED